MTKQELRRKAQSIMKREFGFAPTQKQIVLLEAMSDGSSILWSVGKKEYSWSDAHINHAGQYIKESFEVRDSDYEW